MLPPDIPRCRGLKPGMPCPVPADCDCKRMDAEMDAMFQTEPDNRTMLYIATVLALVTAVTFFAVWKTMAADNNAPCLTKEQARAKWPREWLYWHTAHHCWDNVRGTANTASTADGTVQIIRAPKSNRATKADRKDMVARPTFDTNDNNIRPPPRPGNGRPIKVENPSIYFPDLMPGGGAVVAMLQPDAMTRWPLVADFDVDPPRFEPWRERVMPVGH